MTVPEAPGNLESFSEAFQVGVAVQTSKHCIDDVSGGDLRLQDGRLRLVEVVGWLRWKPGHPVTIGPGEAKQTKPHGSRWFVRRRSTWTRAAWPASPLGGPTATG